MSTNLINALRRNYLPANENDAFNWLVNFKTELPRFAALLGIDGGRQQSLVTAFTVYEHAREFAANAGDVYHERVANKNQAAWNPLDTPLTIRPFTARLNLATNEVTPCGALTLAVSIADEMLKNPKCTADVKDALHLNPLPKRQTIGQPEFSAVIKNNKLTVTFTKGEFEYFIAKIDHGTGDFDKEYPLHHSPWRDPQTLPKTEPQIWRVQLIGFLKGDPDGLPGDIIDVAAKQYVAEHAEGAN
jgi:hypothetical protein